MQGDMPNQLSEYRDLNALLDAYRIKLELDGVEPDIAKIVARTQYKYTPHLYRGGYVIPGFGYSVERCSKGQLHRGSAGNPYLVR